MVESREEVTVCNYAGGIMCGGDGLQCFGDHDSYQYREMAADG